MEEEIPKVENEFDLNRQLSPDKIAKEFVKIKNNQYRTVISQIFITICLIGMFFGLFNINNLMHIVLFMISFICLYFKHDLLIPIFTMFNINF